MKKRKWSGFYWMAVTPDEYETPLAVAESSRELAGMLGVHIGTVLSCGQGTEPGETPEGR